MMAGGDSSGSLHFSVDKVHSLRDLIERNKWKKLLKFLETAEGREQVRRSSSAPPAVTDLMADDEEEEEESGSGYGSYDGTALHHAVLRGAPLEIVREIGNAGGPGLASEVDSGGWTALHAAAATVSASSADGERIVVYLLGLIGGGPRPDAVSSAGRDGRTPLHLACMEGPPRRLCSIFDDGETRVRKLCPAVIRALADASPEVVQIEDDSGLTPIDYAVMSVTDIDGKFSPGSKPSHRVLSEEAIAPMMRHCYALWSKRAAKASKAGGEKNASDADKGDEKKTEEALRSERGAWTKRRSSAVRSALHSSDLKVQYPDAAEEGNKTKRQSSIARSTLYAANNNGEGERRKERRMSFGGRNSFGSLMSLEQSLQDFLKDPKGDKSERNFLDDPESIEGIAVHNASFSSNTSSGGGKVYSVRDLIERRKWKKLRKFLETNAGRKQLRGETGESSPFASSSSILVDHQEDTYGTYDGTALHHAVSQGAPLDIVRAIGSTGGPGMWSEVDSGGWTALHTAAASVDGNNGNDLIIYLIALLGFSSPGVSARDEKGRTALHLASMECPPRSQASNGGKARKLCPAVIRTLADASPEAVQVEDDSGLTPLDYAVMSVTDLDGKFLPDASKPSSAKIVSEAAIFPMVRHCHALWKKRAAEAAAASGEDSEGGEAKARVERGAWTKRRSSAVRKVIQDSVDKVRIEQRRFTDSVVDMPGLADEAANNCLRQPPTAVTVAR